jgi:hypothetical protein
MLCYALARVDTASYTARPRYFHLRDRFCAIRFSMVYMGRAIPVAWRVIEHLSSSVTFARYEELLKPAQRLLPQGVTAVSLADRGFVNRKLTRALSSFGWEWRVRVETNQVPRWGSRGSKCITPRMQGSRAGKAILFDRSINFGQGLMNLSFSTTWGKGESEPWFILSNRSAGMWVFCGLRSALRY